MKEIYTVVAIQIGDPIWQHGLLHIQSQRIVGWYPFFTEAEEVVCNNHGFIHDGAHPYDYCLIERTEVGLYPETEGYWFKWQGNGYRETDEPKGLEGLANFGIG